MDRDGLIKKYGSIRKAADAMKIPRSTLHLRLKGVAPKKKENPGKGVKKTLSDFRASYDKAFIVPKKVRDGIKLLGSAGWEYEVAFAKLAGVSLADLGNFRDLFTDYIVNLKDSRRAWAGSVKTAKIMRDMI